MNIIDWWHEGDMCRIRIGTCQMKAARERYNELLHRHRGSITETSELEFWSGYYNLN